MVDIKQGQNKKIESSRALVEFFRNNAQYTGKLYIGYPILYTGGENIILDAIWISLTHGIVVFDLVEGTILNDSQKTRDKLYNKVESELKSHSELTEKRQLLFNIEVVTFAPACKNIDGSDNFLAFGNDLKDLLESLRSENTVDENIYRTTVSIIQSVIQIKVPTDRGYIKKTSSKGAIVKRLEETIANLDNQQETAVIEYHDGLQRIRGLAGSGKTIVLALKAAYLHTINPEWDIIITFNTRSLKKQFNDLIELFCIQKMGRKPNENKIRVIQAWGGSSNTGVYYEYCKENNVIYHDYESARLLSSSSGILPFDFICQKAIEETKDNIVAKTYDVILVDEAQDLSESFLKLCYKILSKEKRLIYAYDELQKLNEGSPLGNPKKIFNNEAEFSDIILKKCYRNPRPVLVTAHALGFGIYRENGLVQFFDQPELWQDLGYKEKEDKALRGGNQVTLYRTDEATHKFLEQETDKDEIISFTVCQTSEEQAKAIADDIESNLKVDELLYSDIIVINPLSLTTRSEVALVRKYLENKRIKSHIAGDSNKDEFFRENSIAFTGINRAKGNEVPVVYVMNGHDCYLHPKFQNRGLRERRNILFTALTRSKAWAKVYGIGLNMQLLSQEFNKVKDADFKLKFMYPTSEEINKINLISRDINDDEARKIIEETGILAAITKMVERIKMGEASVEDYPQEYKLLINKLLKNHDL